MSGKRNKKGGRMRDFYLRKANKKGKVKRNPTVYINFDK